MLHRIVIVARKITFGESIQEIICIVETGSFGVLIESTISYPCLLIVKSGSRSSTLDELC